MFQSLKSKLNYDATDMQSKFSNMKNKLNFNYLIGSLKNIFIFVICILVASCKMSSDIMPFGVAMLGAINVINVPLIIPFILMATTTGICFGGVALLKFIIASLLFVAIKSFIKNENTKIGNTGIIVFSTVIAEIIGLSLNGVLLYDALLSVYTSIVTGIFYLIFAEGIRSYIWIF